MANTFDIVITCMGRLEQLKQSLPQAIKQQAAHCYLVDYSCPDSCGDWAEQQGLAVTVVRVGNQTVFNLSKARNSGAMAGTAPWILFADADISLSDHFTQHFIGNLEAGCSYHAQPSELGKMGTFLCSRQYFLQVRGYDEVIQGWGCEDADLYERLTLAGVKKDFFPAQMLASIAHSDASRTEHYAVKNIEQNHLGNRLYVSAIRDVTRLTGHWPDTQHREQYYQIAHSTVQHAHNASGCNDLFIELRKENIRGTELSNVLQYHIDQQPGRWQPGSTDANAPNPSRFAEARRAMEQRWPALFSDSEESPIFLLASGFRCGSTLLQRMLFKQCWLWGEPYGRTGLIDHLIAPFLQFGDIWPPDDFIEDHPRFQTDLESTWTANLYPAPDCLLKAAQLYLEGLLKVSAHAKGFDHWGLKEVRFTADHALFLRWLYPRARLIFLYRNPYHAYRSYRKYPNAWYLRHPDHLIDTPEKFARHWLATTSSFIEEAQALKARLVCYEDLVKADYDWPALESYLGFSVDRAVLNHKVEGAPESGFAAEIDISNELERMAYSISPLAESLGYYPRN